MKKLIVFAAILVSAVTSQAAYLWWQIEDQTAQSGLAGEWDVANIYARNLKTGEKGTVIGSTKNIYGSGTSPLVNVEVSDLGDSYGYYIELVNNTTGLVGYTSNSESQTYAALSDSITTTLSKMPTAVWHGGTINAPEPTSAMLMLLGVAGLALKRKQKKA